MLPGRGVQGKEYLALVGLFCCFQVVFCYTVYIDIISNYMQRIIMGAVGVGAILAAGYYYTAHTENGQQTPDAQAPAPAVVVTRSKEGYTPKEVTIKKGETVLFKNESGEYHWPASDLHPTHAIYSAFDPLRPVKNGEDWSFTFDQVGTWKYHDHIRANKVGTVVVQ
jgi:plastocyanin